MLGRSNCSDGSSSSGSSSSDSSGGGTSAAPSPKPQFLSGRKAVVWARHYSAEDAARCDCQSLAEALKKVPGAQRMVSSEEGGKGGMLGLGLSSRVQ